MRLKLFAAMCWVLYFCNFVKCLDLKSTLLFKSRLILPSLLINILNVSISYHLSCKFFFFFFFFFFFDELNFH